MTNTPSVFLRSSIRFRLPIMEALLSMNQFDPLSKFPDTEICTASTTYLAGLSTPSMINHCQRTYRFALAIGANAGLRPDLEVLYISSIFHKG